MCVRSLTCFLLMTRVQSAIFVLLEGSLKSLPIESIALAISALAPTTLSSPHELKVGHTEKVA